MSCVYIHPDASEVSGDQSDLCTVCQMLDLPRLTGSPCSLDHDEAHFHIGPLRNIIAKEFCPSCRLIATVVSNLNLDNEHPETINVTLQMRFSWILGKEGLEKLKPLKMSMRNTGTIIEVFIEHALPPKKAERRPFRRSAGAIIRSATRKSGESADADVRTLYGGQMVSPVMDITRIKSWIQICEAGHSRCRARADRVEILRHMIRLVDVQEQLIVESSMAEKYAALSYVWGSNANPTLKSGNIGQLSSPGGLRGTNIPQTIVEAMYLVKELGIRYLWVDSICIIQDDAFDKSRQLPIMDEIYQQAFLVVVAATGSGAHAGLPGITQPRTTLIQQSENVNGIDFNTSCLSLTDALENSTWATRGWTYQEGLLSRRALVVTESMTYWDCWDSNGREDRVGDEASPFSDWSEVGFGSSWRTDFMWSTDSSIMSRWGDFKQSTPCRTALYCEHVTAYQRRKLGKQSDALWAFLGILKLQKIRFPKGFIWALPYERLDAILLWSRNTEYTCMHMRQVEHHIPVGGVVHKLPYPSWSWLSSDTPIQFLDLCGGSVISKVEWHNPIGCEDPRYAMSFHTTEATNRVGDEDTPFKAIMPDWLSGVEAVDFGLLHLTAHTAHLLVRWKAYQWTQWSYATILSLDGEEISNLWINSSVAGLQEERRTQQAPRSGQSCHPDEASDDENPESGTIGLRAVSHKRITSKQEEGVRESLENSEDEPLQEISDDQLPASESSNFLGEEVEYLREFLLLSANARKESDETCIQEEEGRDCGSIKHIDGCEHIESYNVMLIDWSGGVAHRRGLGIIGKDEWERNAKTEKKTIILG